jgi:hypothetical protein
MNEHRLERLKRLAAGAALVTATLAQAGDPKPVAKPTSPGAEPIRMNSPGPQQPQPEPAVADAGVKNVEEAPKPDPKPPTVNSPPRPKPPNVNSPPRPTK